jgi:hypothetical protein
MGKSLKDVAKQIITESAGDPDRDAKKSTPNASTLRPNSKGAEGRFSTPGSTAPSTGADDLGSAPVSVGAGDNLGAKASGSLKKDTTVKGSTTAAEKPKKQAEVMEEEIDLDEDEQLDELSSDTLQNAYHTAYERGEAYRGKTAKKYGKQGARIKAYHDKKYPDKKDTPKYGVREDFELDEELEDFINGMVAEGYSEEEIAQAIDENFELVSEETEEEYEVDMSEHVEALFAGEELSEEFKEKAVTIFEAAVKQKVEEEIARLEEAYAETLEEQVAQIQEDLSSNVDDYLNYVVEQWVAENEVAIEAGLRTELTEEFITGLRQLFAEHYIDIPEDKVSVVEEMSSKVSELEEKLNEEIERNVALNKMISESKQYEILVDACDGLTTTQAEKLKALSEGVEFTSPTEYTHKINILRESYFNSSFKSDNVLDNNEVENDGQGMISEELKGPMASYVRTLGKKLPN